MALESILGKVSFQAVYDDSILEALAYARESGFSGVQVAVEAPHLSFQRLCDAECAQIAAFCSANGLTLSLHGPDVAASLFEWSPHLRDGIFRYFTAMFDAAETMGARLVTLHLGRMPTYRTADGTNRTIPRRDLAHFRQALQGNLRRLIDLSAGRFVLCVENFALNAMAMEVLQGCLDAGELALCWDLAKMRDDEQVQAFLWSNIQRVRQAHLHDVRGGLSHWVIGTGTVDFLHFLPHLARANVLDYCIEVRPRDKAAESLAYLKRLIEGYRRG